MKIICIGRNYAEHAKEMNAPVPSEPILFLKPETALLQKNLPFYYPEFSKEIHHEVELVLKISKMGRHIEPMFANRYYDEIGIGIDFTARDIQMKCKEKGLPWEKAKAFDHSAPIGKFLPKSRFPLMDDIDFHLNINGKKVQHGNTKDLLFTFDNLIAYASTFFTLKKGDLIFTGTPVGVGPVEIGDWLEAYIGNEKLLAFEIK
ncbi:MAG: fumarylacetoacetate hydrolase family protein [Bacteroidetes bacterium]|jgi:2-keto-4-pentenoate hydratase/2-oxohepta-3-ene-1,7-dioic acid hydratase in catechol pathway|nr:fumarylacetoacetate hydrolase family protein [Bacteroidota bacterium]